MQINILSWLNNANITVSLGLDSRTFYFQVWPFFWRFGKLVEEITENVVINNLYLGPILLGYSQVVLKKEQSEVSN